MKADTTKQGAVIAVSHGGRRRPDGELCHGGKAVVVEAHAETFAARCECGWRFAAMHSAGYNVA